MLFHSLHFLEQLFKQSFQSTAQVANGLIEKRGNWALRLALSYTGAEHNEREH